MAWKTGTSWGFRDAWAAGVFGRYVLVVWVGNFDGSSNPAFIGVTAAAPLFFRIVDSVRGQTPATSDAWRVPPATLSRVEVCAASGDLPNEHCPERADTWFIPGKSPIRVSTLHRSVLVDTRTGRATCGETSTTRQEIHEFWSSDMLRLFREAGMPRRAPPSQPACAARFVDATDGEAPQITSPLRGAVYTMRLSHPGTVELRATHAARRRTLYWFVNQGGPLHSAGGGRRGTVGCAGGDRRPGSVRASASQIRSPARHATGRRDGNVGASGRQHR